MRPQDMKVITGFCEKEHLEIIEGDMLTILDGRYLLCLDSGAFDFFPALRQCLCDLIWWHFSLWFCVDLTVTGGRDRTKGQVKSGHFHDTVLIHNENWAVSVKEGGGAHSFPTLCRAILICKNYHEMSYKVLIKCFLKDYTCI